MFVIVMKKSKTYKKLNNVTKVITSEVFDR